ncbi:MAG TPA: thermopsin family protease, partial [Thermoplasmata archaeon]|nr:thermopsin family protease [Thermoplasmata archaeon]
MSLGTVLGVWIVAIVSVASGVFVAPMASAGGTNAAGLPPVASSPFHPVGVPTDQGLGTASDSPDLAARILSAAQAAHLPPHTVFLPNLLYPARVSGGVVHPTYSTAPAPIGLGDFGVRNTSGRAVPYVIQSTSWEGSLTLDRISPFLVDSLGDAFTAQLNTVTTNTTVWGNTSGSFWIQNVIDYSPSVGTVSFLDNIWNFSSPGFQEPASTFLSYNGTPVPSVGFYFDVGPSIAQSLPFTVHLYVNTSTTRNLTTGDGNPTVRFGFNLLNASGASVGHGVYDTVQFNSQRAFPLVPLTKFMVNGARLTPTNRLLYDSEIMIGGPGGGTSTRIYDISGSESLSFLNATSGRFQNDPTAWNVGGDTGETADGISETYATAGMVDLSPGPSFVLPLWNATPGGHIGTARISGTLSPSNTFLFSRPSGTSFNGTRAAWVPSAPTGAF